MVECPGNTLPLYTEFPDGAIETLETLMSGESGRVFRNMPRYQRARAGLVEEARAQLKKHSAVETSGDRGREYANLYRDRVAVCLDSGLQTRTCTPNSEIKLR